GTLTKAVVAKIVITSPRKQSGVVWFGRVAHDSQGDCNLILASIIVPEYTDKNVFDKWALRFSVFFLLYVRRQFLFQLVIGCSRFWMSSKIIAECKVARPKIALLDHA